MSTCIVDRRTDRSWYTYVAMSVVKRIGVESLMKGPWFLRSADADTPQAGSPALDVPRNRMRGCTVHHRKLLAFNLYDITPSRTTDSGPKTKLIFYAGGGFHTKASTSHWEFAAELTNLIPNTTSVLVSYPLSPINTADVVYKDIEQIYLALLSEAKKNNEFVIVGGDSAGGHFSLGLPLSTLKNGDANTPRPDVILTISPAVSFTADNPDMDAIEPFDPMLSKVFCVNAFEDWRGTWPNTDPRLTLLNADLSVLSGINIVGVIGTYDMLAPDGLRFVELSKAANLTCEWLVWEKQMHCFPLAFANGLPEAIESKTWIVAKINAKRM